MTDHPKPCPHGRNFCLECHGKEQTLGEAKAVRDVTLAQRDRLAELLREIVLVSGVSLPDDISDGLPAGPDLIALGTQVIDRLRDLNKVERVALEVGKANDRLIAQASASPEQGAALFVRQADLDMAKEAGVEVAICARYRELNQYVIPLYTHPSAEIERLRAELGAESKGADRAAEAMLHWKKEADSLRQKLGEAQALLRRWDKNLGLIMPSLSVETGKFLAATAQPASPWIKCSDRLPDPEEHIRVFAVSAISDSVTIWAASSLLRNPSGFDMWMPLPAVPNKYAEDQNDE